MSLKRLTRRDMLKYSGIAVTGTVLAACAPKVVEKVVKETVVKEVEKVVEKPVEKVVEKVVKETVIVAGTPKVVEKVVKEMVTVTPAPRQAVTIVMMYLIRNFPEEDRKLFEEKYAPYKLEMIELDGTKMMAMLAAGQQLDVYYAVGNRAPADVLKRLPLDLTDYFEVSDVFRADDIQPVNDYYVVHDRRYGFVKDWSLDFSVFIRKDYFNEAGITPPKPDEFVHLKTWREWSGPLMKREGDRVLRWGTSGFGVIPLKYQPTTYATPRHLFTEDFTKINILNDPDNYEATKFVFEWKQEGTLPSAINPCLGGWPGPDFRDGHCASVMYGYWYTGYVMKAEWDLNANIVMLPAPTWGPTYSNPCSQGTGGAISASTRIPDAAWTLFQYFFGEEPAENRARIGYGLPGLKHLLDLVPREEPWRKQAFDMVTWDMANSKTLKMETSPYVGSSDIGVVWSKYEEAALKGDITFDEILEKFEAEVNELIREGMERAGL